MLRILAAVILVLLTSELARGQSCDAALATCEQDLAASEHVRQTCVIDLAEALTYEPLFDACQRAYFDVTRDTDVDGAPDRTDQCPHTDANLAVDLAGCSLRQFCELRPAVRDRDRQTCRRLDWQNDEPHQVNPRDCRPEAALCGPAIPEPLEDRACQNVLVTVTTAYAGVAAGVSTFVRYPGDAVELPGFGSDALLYTTNVSGVAGLFNAGDSDSDFDGRDDTAAASLISIEEPILPGPFASFRFVCVPLGPLPRAQDFSCVSDVATLGGVTVPSSCTVELATEP